MRLTKANSKAIKYAIMHWHYSRSVPSVSLAYNVYNDNDEWCGVVAYGIGANNNIAKAYNLGQGEVVELVRVALNGKQKTTSQAVAISLKLLKKDAPLVKLVVSYADTAQGHEGTIYKASNWDYVGDSMAESAIDPADGKVKHTRTLHSIYGSVKGFERVKDKPKKKFVYYIDKTLKGKIKKDASLV